MITYHAYEIIGRIQVEKGVYQTYYRCDSVTYHGKHGDQVDVKQFCCVTQTSDGVACQSYAFQIEGHDVLLEIITNTDWETIEESCNIKIMTDVRGFTFVERCQASATPKS